MNWSLHSIFSYSRGLDLSGFLSQFSHHSWNPRADRNVSNFVPGLHLPGLVVHSLSQWSGKEETVILKCLRTRLHWNIFINPGTGNWLPIYRTGLRRNGMKTIVNPKPSLITKKIGKEVSFWSISKPRLKMFGDMVNGLTLQTWLLGLHWKDVLIGKGGTEG